MYEIYAYPNGDLDKKLLIHKIGTAQYQVMNPKLTREVSKSGSLTFVMTRDHPQYNNHIESRRFHIHLYIQDSRQLPLLHWRNTW